MNNQKAIIQKISELTKQVNFLKKQQTFYTDKEHCAKLAMSIFRSCRNKFNSEEMIMKKIKLFINWLLNRNQYYRYYNNCECNHYYDYSCCSEDEFYALNMERSIEIAKNKIKSLFRKKCDVPF